MQMPTDAAPPLVSLYQNPLRTGAAGRGRDDDAHTGGRGRVGQPGGITSGFAQSLNDIRRDSATATPGATSTDSNAGIEAVLDTLNPMQHLPVVSNFYRSATGDDISAPARIAGGALFGSLLFGGPIGIGLAIANVVTEEVTGRDIGGNALAMLGFESPDAAATAQAFNAAGVKNAAQESANEKAAPPDGTPEEGQNNAANNDQNNAVGRGPLAPLYQHLDVTRWAEEESRFRSAEASRHNAGAAPRATGDDQTAETQLVGSLMAGVQQTEALNAARQYGAAGTLGQSNDPMPAAFDTDG